LEQKVNFVDGNDIIGRLTGASTTLSVPSKPAEGRTGMLVYALALTASDPMTRASASHCPPFAAATPEDSHQWFLREINPHRDCLRGWLGRRFSGLRDAEDLVQEACLRVWRAKLGEPPE